MRQGMLEVTGVDLVKLIQEAYKLSQPMGLGFLHYREGGLEKEEAETLVEEEGEYAVSMDYILGRCVKFNVWREHGKLFIRDRWPDHTHILSSSIY